MRSGFAWITAAAVTALAGCGGSEEDLRPPATPANVAAVPGDGMASVRWDAVAGADGYVVYWSSAPGVSKASGTALPTQATSVNHTELTNGATYYYVVTAVNAAGESPESAEVSATPLPSHYPLTLTPAGDGGGTVTSTPAGIDCGATCAASFPRDATVTLTAMPDATSTFDGWTGDCSGTDDCTILLDGARSVTPTFTRITHELSVTLAGAGGGTVTSTPAGIDCGATCAFAYVQGNTVTLTATPDATSTFTGWSGACTGTTDCVLTMDAARSATATFTRITYALAVSRNGTGGGALTATPPGITCCTIYTNWGHVYDTGTTVTLVAAPDATSTFSGWTGACSGTSTTCVVTMDAAKQVFATFTRNTYTLTVNRTATGGTVTSSPAGINCGPTCAANYVVSTMVTLTATPDATTTFVGWTGACTGASTTCTLTMDAAKTVTARFLNQLSVTRSGTGAGTVTSAPSGISCGSTCTASYDTGTVVTLTAAPDSTSDFIGWTGGGCTSGTCVVTMDVAKSVNATFGRKTFSLEVTTNGWGSVTSNPSGIMMTGNLVRSATFTAGTVVTLTAAPSEGAFLGWSGACSGTALTCQVTMDGAKTVGATFSSTLTAFKSGQGGGTVVSSPPGIDCGSTCSTAGFAPGTVVTLTATPDGSSVFSGWAGPCSGLGTCTVTVNSSQTVTARFMPVGPIWTLDVTTTGWGSVTSSPAGIMMTGNLVRSATFADGTLVTLTAQPSEGAFLGWSGACSGTALTCQVTMGGAKTVGATFSSTLSVYKSGQGGGAVVSSPPGIDCGSTCSTAGFAPGTVVTLTATPDGSSVFSGWSGPCSGLGTCTVTVNNSQTVTARFMP